jgi:hypothetical protein
MSMDNSTFYSKMNKRILFIPLFEWVIILFIFLGMLLVLAKFAGGPVNSDNLFYMDAGLNGIKSFHTLFYYFHIYFQRFFMEIASSPLAGAKLFWAFLISLTSLLIYLITRILTKQNSWVNALLAVAIFFSASFLSKYSGRTENDLTAMMIITLIFFFYLLAFRTEFSNLWIIGLLGFLFFLAFKSKETALLCSYIILGIGFSDTGNFNFQKIIKKIPFLLLGFFLGGLFFILLNTIIVKDPFWGIRISDFSGYFVGIDTHVRWGDISKNYFSNEILISLLIPFFLYVISGIQNNDNKIPASLKLFWFYPLILVIFFTLLMIFSSGYKILVSDRLFFPAIPILCVLGSQVIHFDMVKTFRDWRYIGLLFMIGILIAIFIHYIIMITIPITKYQYNEVVQNIIQPLFLSFLLISLFWKKPIKIQRLSVPVICLIVLLFHPTLLSFKSLLVDRPNSERANQIFYPFSAFSDQINYSPNMKFYISSSINKEQQMLLKRADEVSSIFNVYFREDSNVENFINPIIYNIKKGELFYLDPLKSLPAMNYDYALITTNDWTRIKDNAQLFASISNNYEIIFDDQGAIGLLIRK